MIYLASASPRRQELLRQLGIAFEAVPSNLHEECAAGESPEQYVTRVALDKARHVAGQLRQRAMPPHPVLGADTEVVLDGEILGKPKDRDHGLAMLKRLAGRTHEVLTGIAVLRDGADRTALSRSVVTFAPLDEATIRRYWDSGEPLGKAGGYAVQGKAAAFIARIEGSYSGIMGLPLYELSRIMEDSENGNP